MATSLATKPTAVPPARRSQPESRGGRIWPAWAKPLASLRLTVMLLVLAMILVFAGTLATTRLNILAVQQQYFYSLLATIDIGRFHIPFPGGYTLGGLLLINLVAAHVYRFGLRWKRLGILLTHAGLAVLLIGGLATSLGSVEAQMALTPGQPLNFIEDVQHPELVVLESQSAEIDRVVAFSGNSLRAGHTLTHGSLPLEIHVDQYFANSTLEQAAAFPAPGLASGPSPAPGPAGQGVGQQWRAVALPVETDIGHVDAPSAYVTITAGRVPIGRWLLSFHLAGQLQDVQAAGRTFQIALRPRRYYQPYRVELIKFTHENYPGTDKPKTFSSQVRVTEPAAAMDFEYTISMNHPLRFAGQTFYQAGFQPGDVASILQVVRNPSWRMPYVGCLMVGAGLLLHFTQRLITYLGRLAR